MSIRGLWEKVCRGAGATLFGTLLLACGSGGGAAVGEACTTVGSADECAEDAACDRTDEGATVCLKICVSQSDCASDENCNGLTNDSTTKVCQPKK